MFNVKKENLTPAIKVSSSKLWMDIAMAEMGQTEIKGEADNARILEYFTATSYHASDDETPWCAAFVNWVLMSAGIARTMSAAALSFLQWGVITAKPQYGDVVVINRGGGRGHVGFFTGYDRQGRIGILGGNQNDSVNISWFDAGLDIQFRRERKLKDSNTAKIAAGTIVAEAAVVTASVVAAANSTVSSVGTVAAKCAETATNTGANIDSAISIGIDVVHVLSTLPLGSTAEAIIALVGSVLVAFEKQRKLKVVNA